MKIGTAIGALLLVAAGLPAEAQQNQEERIRQLERELNELKTAFREYRENIASNREFGAALARNAGLKSALASNLAEESEVMTDVVQGLKNRIKSDDAIENALLAESAFMDGIADYLLEKQMLRSLEVRCDGGDAEIRGKWLDRLVKTATFTKGVALLIEVYLKSKGIDSDLNEQVKMASDGLGALKVVVDAIEAWRKKKPDLEAELKALRESIQAVEKAVNSEDLFPAIRRMDKEIMRLANLAKDQETEIKALRAKLADVQGTTEVGQVKTDLATLQKEWTGWREFLKEAPKEIADLETKVAALEKRLADTQKATSADEVKKLADSVKTVESGVRDFKAFQSKYEPTLKKVQEKCKCIK